jgi:hypothetical protein
VINIDRSMGGVAKTIAGVLGNTHSIDYYRDIVKQVSKEKAVLPIEEGIG